MKEFSPIFCILLNEICLENIKHFALMKLNYSESIEDIYSLLLEVNGYNGV